MAESDSERSQTPLTSKPQCSHALELASGNKIAFNGVECPYCKIDRLRAALEPFAKLHEARTTIYQKRGGNLDSFPDSHPAYYITASQLRLGIWRRAAEAYIGGSSDETNGESNWKAVRAHELRYIESVLLNIRCQHGENARESAHDTLAWLRNRLAVKAPETTAGVPVHYGSDGKLHLGEGPDGRRPPEKASGEPT